MSQHKMIENIFSSNGISLSMDEIEKLICYFDLLTEWNQKINLTAITDFETVVYKHFLDSALILKCDGYNKEKKNRILDVGTGAGFPGIILAILRPEDEFSLMDSLNKRVEFLKIVIQNLGLTNVFVYHGRAEDYGKKSDFRNQFDYVVSRALAELPLLLEYCIPFVKRDGYFISYKGPKYELEMDMSEYAMEQLECKIETVEKFQINDEWRYLLWIKNQALTNSKYPRRAGKPKKSPLLKK